MGYTNVRIMNFNQIADYVRAKNLPLKLELYTDLDTLRTMVFLAETNDKEFQRKQIVLEVEAKEDALLAKLNPELFDNKHPIFGNASNNGQRDKYGVLSKLTLETHGAFPTTHYFSGLIEEEKEFFTPSTDFIERDRELQSYVGEYRGEFGDIFFVNAAARDDQNSTESALVGIWRARGDGREGGDSLHQVLVSYPAGET